MQKLADDFTSKNPGIELKWVTLEENVLPGIAVFLASSEADYIVAQT